MFETQLKIPHQFVSQKSPKSSKPQEENPKNSTEEVSSHEDTIVSAFKEINSLDEELSGIFRSLPSPDELDYIVIAEVRRRASHRIHRIIKLLKAVAAKEKLLAPSKVPIVQNGRLKYSIKLQESICHLNLQEMAEANDVYMGDAVGKLKGTLDQMSITQRHLEESSQTIKKTGETYDVFQSRLSNVSNLFRTLRKRAESNSFYVWISFFFFTGVCGFILLKRLRLLRLAVIALSAILSSFGYKVGFSIILMATIPYFSFRWRTKDITANS